MAAFKSLGSRQSLSFPFSFSTTTNEFTQSVGVVTSLMTPVFSILSNSSFSLCLIACGTRRGEWTTGVAFSFRCMVISPSKSPRPEKRCLYSSMTVFFVNRESFCGNVESETTDKTSWMTLSCKQAGRPRMGCGAGGVSTTWNTPV